MIALDAKLASRFWRQVDVKSAAECWNWTSFRDKGGYGKITVGSKSAGTYGKQAAHRLALMLTGTEVQRGAFVCHHCDNPACCNPAHLYLGDAKQNALDLQRRNRGKGRHHQFGERNPNYKHGRRCGLARKVQQ